MSAPVYLHGLGLVCALGADAASARQGLLRSDAPGGVAYHIHFDSLPGRVLQIPEIILEPAEASESNDVARIP